MSTFTFLLPSCAEAEVGKMKLRHLRKYTNLAANIGRTSLIDMLADGLVIRIGSDMEINKEKLNELTAADISLLAIAARSVSYGDEEGKTIKVRKQWGDKVLSHTLDVSFESFKVKYRTPDKEKPKAPIYKSFEDIPKKQSVKIAGREFVFDILSFRTEVVRLANIKPINQDWYTKLLEANLSEVVKGTTEKMKIQDVDDLDIDISEKINAAFLASHGDVDVQVTVTNPLNKSETAVINILAEPVFFCPSATP